MSPEYIVLYENGSIKPGDAIKFKLKKIISNEKLSLTQNEIETESSKWATAKAKYKVNSYAIGTIKRILPYGAFIELEEGIVGLLHKSNIKDGSELEVSQEIKVKVLLFDADNKKIILDV
jgi:ribosomal protein S1